MDDWMDLNDDGVIDASERMFADEMLCSSREEHMALFGNEGDFADDTTDDLDDDLLLAGLGQFELEAMDEDEWHEALEDAGLDPDDYDFF